MPEPGTSNIDQTRQEHKEYKLQLQLFLAVRELYDVFITKELHDVSIENLRGILRTMDTIEGLTIEQAEAQAKGLWRADEDIRQRLAAEGSTVNTFRGGVTTYHTGDQKVKPYTFVIVDGVEVEVTD
jgi:hypothetical protein